MKIGKKKRESYFIEISYEANCWDLLCEYYFMSEKTLKKKQLKLKRRLDSMLKINKMVAKKAKKLKTFWKIKSNKLKLQIQTFTDIWNYNMFNNDSKKYLNIPVWMLYTRINVSEYYHVDSVYQLSSIVCCIQRRRRLKAFT